jgi:hypothetical protein
MKDKEFQLHIRSATGTYDLSPLLDRLPYDVEYIKIRLDAFSVGIENTGANDFIQLSLKTNAYSAFVLGDSQDRDVLYTSTMYITAGNIGTVNDLGATTRYMIVSSKELRKPFGITWTTSQLGTGAPQVRTVYAKLSFLPIQP